ncbi:CRE-SRG-15 protein [Caenorhabditis remanei]|uniref:Serpentine receptor class gamma n=1 Tax=Caenorhabditis remanei TaxID=31234 RepID=E3M0Y4_CAERE|nr:CRE-SRG-15 protein [Caenorhabditis remanei]
MDTLKTVDYEGYELTSSELSCNSEIDADVRRREYFKNSSFFTIFGLDSVASIILIVWDVCFGRLFLYVSPLCPIVGPYFWMPSMIPKNLLLRADSCKIREISSSNNHGFESNDLCFDADFLYWSELDFELERRVSMRFQIWARLTPISIVLIFLLPLGGTWNLLLSPRYYLVPSYGGFAVVYVRAVTWATASLFQSIYILTALGFTVICTSITLYKLILLRARVKSAERSLCFTNIFISFTFLLVAATQLYYLACIPCRTSDYLFAAQFLAFDTFTVG